MRAFIYIVFYVIIFYNIYIDIYIKYIIMIYSNILYKYIINVLIRILYAYRKMLNYLKKNEINGKILRKCF